MTLPLTEAALIAIRQLGIEPQVVFSIDGVPTKFGSGTIQEKIKIGMDGLFINNSNGNPWEIGGVRAIGDQIDAVSFGGSGTTTRITQQLQPDKGIGSSVTQLNMKLLDENENLTELISPGFIVPEILARKCKIEIGFEGTSYPEDYITVLRGIIGDIDADPVSVKFVVQSPTQRLRNRIFQKQTSQLVGNISNTGSVSSITVDDASSFLAPINGPSGSPDSTIEFYVQINDEFFKYTGKSGNTLTGVTRNPSPYNFGQAAHADGDDVSTVIRLTGNALDIARKIMLSGWNGYFKTGYEVESFVRISPTETVANAVFFYGNIEEEIGIFKGDYITTTGASNAANNTNLKEILEIVKTNSGSYLVIDGVNFVEENNSSATISFRSKWDVYPEGSRLFADEVDLKEIDIWFNLFLSSVQYDFTIKEGIEPKSFIDEQIFRPMASYSLPRKGKISMGFTIPPLPRSQVPTLNQDSVQEASKLVIKRSISNNFYNSIVYNYEQDRLEGNFKRVFEKKDNTAINDFGLGKRSMIINAQGMYAAINAVNLADSFSVRTLNRYVRGAEYIDNVKVSFEVGFPIEVGDIVLLDMSDLKIADTKSGTRLGEPRLFEVLNKSMDISTGDITINITDTAYDPNNVARYGLISPSSLVHSGISQTEFVISSSYNSPFGQNEFKKWERYGQIFVRIRSENGVTRNAVRQIQSFAGNKITLFSALGFVPQTGDIMEFADYNDVSLNEKIVYVAMRDTDPFDDGRNRYLMI